MLKNVYFIRLGNKQTDIKKFKDFIPLENIKTVVEPFAGTFAVSRNIFYDDKYKKHINDLDKCLYDFLIELQTNYKTINDIYAYIKKKVDNDEATKENIKEYILTTNFKSVLCDTFFIRGFLSKRKCVVDFKPLSDFLKKCKITNEDYKIILETYKNDKTAFLFCDPPYLDSDNKNYNTRSLLVDIKSKVIQDNTKMYVDLAEYIKVCKCKILIIINENALMHYIFKDYIKGNYERIYQISKKKTTHLIINNY